MKKLLTVLMILTMVITGCSNIEQPVNQNNGDEKSNKENQIVEEQFKENEIMEYQIQLYEDVIIVFDHKESKNHQEFWKNKIKEIKKENINKEVKIIDLSKRGNRFSWVKYDINEIPHVVIK